MMFLILVITATVIGFYIFAFARRSSLRAQNPERAGFLAVNKYRQQRPSTHLATMQRLIERRFDEIVAKQRQVAEVMRRVPAPDSEEWLTIENALKCADRALQIQQNRYRFKSKEVAILIWQEGIPSLASDLETLDFNQMGARLKVIDYAEKRGARLLKMLEVENAENVQVRHLMQSVTESLASLRGLSKAIVSRRALSTLRGISPLKDSAENTTSFDEYHRTNIAFNSAVSLTDFSTSLNELEEEYVTATTEMELAPLLKSRVA